MRWCISLPSDKILFLLPISPMFEDLLDLPFFLAIDKIRWWL